MHTGKNAAFKSLRDLNEVLDDFCNLSGSLQVCGDRRWIAKELVGAAAHLLVKACGRAALQDRQHATERAFLANELLNGFTVEGQKLPDVEAEKRRHV